MALQNIKNNKLRSFLTMLGIVIGVGAVIALITIVESVTGYVINQFEELGAGTISLTAQGTNYKHGLTEDDLETIASIEGVDAVAPSASMNCSVVYDNEVTDGINVQGVSAVYFSHNSTVTTSGRLFNSAESSGESNVAVVDQDFVDNVLNGEGTGTEFILNGYRYEVIGVTKNDDSVMSALSGSSDGTVTVPYKNVLKMSSQKNVTSADIYYSEDTDSSDLQDRLKAALDKIFNVDEDSEDEAYTLISMDSLLDTMQEIETMMTTMLAGIASISLVVGGIGIMNMMLVSVSERTKEIGLRKALGAQPSRIQMQFLIESITLSVIGGIIGIILGILVAILGSTLLGTTFSLSGGAILLGMGFSSAVGIIFGWMPAKRASALNPIDALRSE